MARGRSVTKTNSDEEEIDRQLEQAHRVLDDTLIVKLASVNNAQRSRKEAVDQRVKIIQDIMNVSLTVLGGAITLQIFAHHTVKTRILFYIGVTGLLLCVISALVIRIIIASGWDKALNALSEMEEKIRLAVGV